MTDIIIHCYSQSTIGWACFTEAGCASSSDWLGLFYRGWACVIQWLVGLVLQRLGMCHPVIGWACFTEAGHVSSNDWMGLFYRGWACVIWWLVGLFFTEAVCVSSSGWMGLFYQGWTWNSSTVVDPVFFKGTESASCNDMLGLFYKDRECLQWYAGIAPHHKNRKCVLQWYGRNVLQGDGMCPTVIVWDCSTRTGSVCSDMLGLLLTTRTGSVSYNDMVGMFYREMECVLQW